MKEDARRAEGVEGSEEVGKFVEEDVCLSMELTRSEIGFGDLGGVRNCREERADEGRRDGCGEEVGVSLGGEGGRLRRGNATTTTFRTEPTVSRREIVELLLQCFGDAAVWRAEARVEPVWVVDEKRGLLPLEVPDDGLPVSTSTSSLNALGDCPSFWVRKEDDEVALLEEEGGEFGRCSCPPAFDPTRRKEFVFDSPDSPELESPLLYRTGSRSFRLPNPCSFHPSSLSPPHPSPRSRPLSSPQHPSSPPPPPASLVARPAPSW